MARAARRSTGSSATSPALRARSTSWFRSAARRCALLPHLPAAPPTFPTPEGRPHSQRATQVSHGGTSLAMCTSACGRYLTDNYDHCVGNPPVGMTKSQYQEQFGPINQLCTSVSRRFLIAHLCLACQSPAPRPGLPIAPRLPAVAAAAAAAVALRRCVSTVRKPPPVDPLNGALLRIAGQPRPDHEPLLLDRRHRHGLDADSMLQRRLLRRRQPADTLHWRLRCGLPAVL